MFFTKSLVLLWALLSPSQRRTLSCIFTRKILWSSTPGFSCSISVLLMTFLSFGVGSGIALNIKNDRSSIPFLDLRPYGDNSSSVLQFSTFPKPLNKYLYIPFESIHPSSNKKAFINGELMRYARNSSSFKSFSETRDKFWKWLRLRGYPFKFLLPLFRDVPYNDRKKWFSRPLNRRSRPGRIMVLKSMFNCSHARIKNVINNILQDLDCTMCHRKTVTIANLCK